MALGRLSKKAGGSVVGLAALGALGIGVEPAGAATATATYERRDKFVLECQAGQACQNPGTGECSIHGHVRTYDDGTIDVGVGTLWSGGGDAGANCYDGSIHIEVTYDPNPSDPATSTFLLDSHRTASLGARGVSAPNFIEARYTVKWVFDVDDPGQTAGPYRLPK